MEPNRELPPINNSENLTQPGSDAEQLSVQPENAANMTGSKQPATTIPTPVVANQPLQTVSQTSQSNPVVTDSDTLIADDTDLIEKEWVSKAKQIVEQTKHDPHLQTNEMSKFKAQYQKKRYNKDAKVSSG